MAPAGGSWLRGPGGVSSEEECCKKNGGSSAASQPVHTHARIGKGMCLLSTKAAGVAFTLLLFFSNQYSALLLSPELCFWAPCLEGGLDEGLAWVLPTADSSSPLVVWEECSRDTERWAGGRLGCAPDGTATGFVLCRWSSIGRVDIG